MKKVWLFYLTLFCCWAVALVSARMSFAAAPAPACRGDMVHYNSSAEELFSYQSCPSNYCDNGSIDLGEYYGGLQEKCWPPGPTTKEPTCRPNRKVIGTVLGGFCHGVSNGINLDEHCCVPAYLFGGVSFGGPASYACANKNNNQPINKCDEVKDNATLTPKDYCGTGGLWEYNRASRKCQRVKGSEWEGKYKTDCTKPDGTKVGGISTAIGCIPTDKLEDFITFLLKYAFFASGGIILLMLIATGYTVITSQGNPEKLQAAKENVTSLFAGLILIAFSLVILQTIGADILGLPTF